MTATDITTMPLTDVETTRLLDLESIVTAGMRTFIEVGNALGEISGSRLYRQTHMTFAAYVRDTFEYGESHAYRLMDAAKMAEIVSPVGEVSRESHARALAGLGPAQARDVWQQVNETTDGKPTALAVAQAREQVAPRPVQTAIPVTRRRPLPDQYTSTVWELEKLASRLAKLHQDDRFTANRNKLSGSANLLASVVGNLQDLHLDLSATEAQLDLDGRDQSLSTSGQFADVTIEVGTNTAIVVDGDYEARSALKQLGIASMRDHGTRKLSFPAKHADDLQAALELRRKVVELRNVDAHVVNEVTGL